MPRADRPQDELVGRPREHPLDEVVHELGLGLFLREGGAVHLRSLLVILSSRPLAVMTCIILRVVDRPVSRWASRASWTCRTVLGPRSHSTPRICNSTSVKLGDGLRAMILMLRCEDCAQARQSARGWPIIRMNSSTGEKKTKKFVTPRHPRRASPARTARHPQ